MSSGLGQLLLGGAYQAVPGTPIGTNIAGGAAVASRGHIYIVGGSQGGRNTTNVLGATFTSSTLVLGDAGPALPLPRVAHTAVVF